MRHFVQWITALTLLLVVERSSLAVADPIPIVTDPNAILTVDAVNGATAGCLSSQPHVLVPAGVVPQIKSITCSGYTLAPPTACGGDQCYAITPVTGSFGTPPLTLICTVIPSASASTPSTLTIPAIKACAPPPTPKTPGPGAQATNGKGTTTAVAAISGQCLQWPSPATTDDILQCARAVSGLDTNPKGLTADAGFPKLESRSEDKAVLFYNTDGTPLGQNPQVDEDDDIYVIIVGASDNPIKSTQITTCDAPQQVRVSSSPNPLEKIAAQQQQSLFQYAVVHASHCSADNGLKITVNAKDSKQISIPTLALYRIQVLVALIFDFAQTTQYSAAAVKGEPLPVIAANTQEGGLGAVPFVSLSWVPADTVRVRTFWQAWGPAVGISLAAPTSHIYAGLNIEPWPGLGLVAGWHFQQIQVLANGYQVGDYVPSGSVPTVGRWKNPDISDVFAGIALDGNVLGEILKGLRK